MQQMSVEVSAAHTERHRMIQGKKKQRTLMTQSVQNRDRML